MISSSHMALNTYHLFADVSQTFISSLDFFPELHTCIAYSTPTWMPKEYLKFNRSQTEPLTYALTKPALPIAFPISANSNLPSCSLRTETLQSFWPPFPPLSTQSLSKSCIVYLQNKPRIWPLLLLVQDNPISGCYSCLLTDLPASALASLQSILNTAPRGILLQHKPDPLLPLLKTLGRPPLSFSKSQSPTRT